MEKKITKIPEDSVLINMGVQDIKAWKVWFKIQSSHIINEGKVFMAEDGLTEINLGWLPHHLEKKIRHLPKAEQSEILAKKDKYQSEMSKEAAWKRKAYGTSHASGREKHLETKFNILMNKATEIIELFGKYFSVDEVYEIVVGEWNIPTTKQLLYDFRKTNIKQIEEKKQLFSASFADVRLGHKRARLEELCMMYSIFKSKLLDKKMEQTARLMKDLLKDIKEEVEGDVITINGSIDLNIQATIDHHVRAEALKHLSIRQIIIGRVAAKRDVSPELIIAQLSKSYYSGFNNPDVEDADYEELNYPSDEHYDFNMIESQAEAIKKAKAEEEANRRKKIKEMAKFAAKAEIKKKLLNLIKGNGELLENNRLEIERQQHVEKIKKGK